MKYKHDEVIRAWLDGKTVQCYCNSDGKWVDVDPPDSAELAPAFAISWKYRIKPEPKPDVVRWTVVHNKGQAWLDSFMEENQARAAAGDVGIIKYTISGETGKLKSAEVV